MATKPRRTKKSSNLLQSKVGLIVVAAIVLFLAFFLYDQHQKGVLGTSTQAPPTCSKGVIIKMAVDTYCGSKGSNVYRYSRYTCGNSMSFVEGGGSSCKDMATWYKYATQKCATYCITPTPSPAKTTPLPTKVKPLK